MAEAPRFFGAGWRVRLAPEVVADYEAGAGFLMRSMQTKAIEDLGRWFREGPTEEEKVRWWRLDIEEAEAEIEVARERLRTAKLELEKRGLGDGGC